MVDYVSYEQKIKELSTKKQSLCAGIDQELSGLREYSIEYKILYPVYMLLRDTRVAAPNNPREEGEVHSICIRVNSDNANTNFDTVQVLNVTENSFIRTYNALRYCLADRLREIESKVKEKYGVSLQYIK